MPISRTTILSITETHHNMAVIRSNLKNTRPFQSGPILEFDICEKTTHTYVYFLHIIQ